MSFSATDGVAAFARRSLDVMARECPAGFAAVGAAMPAEPTVIEVDDERFAVSTDGRSTHVTAAPIGARWQVRTRLIDLLALVDGELTWSQAIRGNRLRLRGSAMDLADLYRGLSKYLDGCVRCPTMPELLTELRAGGKNSP